MSVIIIQLFHSIIFVGFNLYLSFNCFVFAQISTYILPHCMISLFLVFYFTSLSSSSSYIICQNYVFSCFIGYVTLFSIFPSFFYSQSILAWGNGQKQHFSSILIEIPNYSLQKIFLLLACFNKTETFLGAKKCNKFKFNIIFLCLKVYRNHHLFIVMVIYPVDNTFPTCIS